MIADRLLDRIINFSATLRLNAAAKYAREHGPDRIRRRINELHLKRRIRNRDRLVPEEELEVKFREAWCFLIQRHGAGFLGDYLEFGVYNGTSLACMYRVVKDLNLDRVRLIGFDSFEGLPEAAATDSGGHWHTGWFKSDYQFTRDVLTHEGINWERVTLIKGFFDSTLNNDVAQKYRLHKASILMIDCDLYLSAKQALEFSGRFLADQSIIFFDDWHPLAEKNMGEKRAFDEFLDAHDYDAQQWGTYSPYGEIFHVVRRSKRNLP